MIINYWDCKFQEAEEYEDVDEDGEIWYDWVYYCESVHNNNISCNIENKWGGEAAECPYAEKLNE